MTSTIPHAVDPVYGHRHKHAAAGEPIVIGDSSLKWYDLAPAADPIDRALIAQARAFVNEQAVDAALPLDGDCGFAILHRCGPDFHFLLVSVWRGSNELWEAVYYRDAAHPAFARFDPAYPDGTTLRPTFCVWELGIVAHEAATWIRFLNSRRNADDLVAWRHDVFTGDV